MKSNTLAMWFIVIMVAIFGAAMVVLNTSCESPARAAASLNEVGDLQKGLTHFYAYPISINWPLSTDETFLYSLPGDSTSGCYFGHPVGYLHVAFQDQSGGSGGEGLTAQEKQHTFCSLNDYGGSGINANQITIYNQEFDGTIGTQDSVVSMGIFLFTPETGLFD